jgi:hypothetical protein
MSSLPATAERCTVTSLSTALAGLRTSARRLGANGDFVPGIAGGYAMPTRKASLFFPPYRMQEKKNRTQRVPGSKRAAGSSGNGTESSGRRIPASLQKFSACMHGAFSSMQEPSASMRQPCASCTDPAACMPGSCASLRRFFWWSIGFAACMRGSDACCTGNFPCMRDSRACMKGTAASVSGPADCGLFPPASTLFFPPWRVRDADRAFALAANAPASLTRRRAFSSGLSHAKCPKPGFRSNVFR